ncbi:TAXI family TRAP transporter solute-binding subunit [Desulfuromonas sp. TF]|uniref:TAXI family TRAP transporter solute-binding subunit n=1 Tax=Desulfuromonas sp. TF TaxID=1232410 RepID=UPI000429131F|nr:TAXI family TRAP transporter solute-binding subunit [Desulfuromonas sp. TF]
MKRLSIPILALVFFTFCGVDAFAVDFVTMGTGGVTGVYYPTGGAISKLVNQKRKEYNLRMTVESTGGSVFNVNSLMNSDLELGIVQSDLQYQAYNGQGDWEGKPQKKLRAVFAIHPEAVTILAAADSNIKNVADMKGKVVNIGAPGTGQRVNALDLFQAAGIDPEKDLRIEGIKPAEAAGMLQDGRIDAFFYTVGHPNGSVKEAVAGARKVNFVPVSENLVQKLTAEQPYYAPAEIPVNQYPGVVNTENVPTFGVKATICSSSDVSEDVIYKITKTVFENIDELRKLHPALDVLTRENMLQGLSAPLHPGAEKYFREAGLIKK